MKKTKEKEYAGFNRIGGYLLLINAIFLFILGISGLLVFTIPAINLSGTIGGCLDNWLIYIISNIPTLLNEIITNLKWQNIVDLINIFLILSANILFFIGSGVSFSRKNKFGLIGIAFFIIALIIILTTPFIANYVFQFPLPTESALVLLIIDTNIIIIIVLGILGGYLSYFQKDSI